MVIEHIFLNQYLKFHSGEWIGVVLDEPKGKNNGTVQKKGTNKILFYFFITIFIQMEHLYDILHAMIIMVSMFDLDKLNLCLMIYNQIFLDPLQIIPSNLKAVVLEAFHHQRILEFQNQVVYQRNKADFVRQHRVQHRNLQVENHLQREKKSLISYYPSGFDNDTDQTGSFSPLLLFTHGQKFVVNGVG